MKTKALFSAAAALAVGALTAQAQVYSVNVVGYANQAFTGASSFSAVANPLDDGTNTLDSLLSSLPVGATVQIWNGSSYDLVNRTPPFLGGWSGGLAGATPLPPGVAAFINVGAGATLTNTWVGEVLTGDLTNSLSAGFNFVGNQAPIAGGADAIGLGAAMAVGDTIQKWNGTSFDLFNKTPPFLGGWSPSEPTIGVAEGFYVNLASPAAWTQTVNP